MLISRRDEHADAEFREDGVNPPVSIVTRRDGETCRWTDVYRERNRGTGPIRVHKCVS